MEGYFVATVSSFPNSPVIIKTLKQIFLWMKLEFYNYLQVVLSAFINLKNDFKSTWNKFLATKRQFEQAKIWNINMLYASQ